MNDHSSLTIILESCPVVPVVTLHEADDVLPLADALLAGGIKTIEITLRTEAGLPAIEALAKSNSDIVTGAGTVTSPALLKSAMDAGAGFLVSPGLTPAIAEAATQHNAPLLPGVATASEAMRAMEWGFQTLKFFPAEQSGGVGMLKNFAAVFPKLRFCPTGGISLNNKDSYLALPNVICVGGSWLTPGNLITDKNWQEITNIATQSSR